MDELETDILTTDGEGKKDTKISLFHSKKETILDLNLLSEEIYSCTLLGFSVNEFIRVSFTHHSEILAKEKSIDGRLYYVSRCANDFWSVDILNYC